MFSRTLLIANFHYLLLMLLAIAASVALSLPVLILPLRPASEGVIANYVYYVVYCGVFSTFWAVTNWNRLEYIFDNTIYMRARSWAHFEHTGLLRGDFRGPYAWGLATAWTLFSATFAGLGFWWGAKMEESLVLFYGAPVAFTLVDCVWFFMVFPESRRSLRGFGCLCALNVLLCAPVLLLFIPSFSDELLREVFGDGVWIWAHDICVPTLIDMAFATGLTTGLPGLLRHAGLPGRDVEEATDFHLNSVFEASLLVGIFDEPYRVVGVVFVTSFIATVQRLRTAEPSVLRMSWTWHIPGLAAPLIYMMHVRLIRTWVNAEHYFVYRCQAGIDWEEKTNVMIALFLTRVTLLQVEVLYSALSSKRQQKDTIDMLRGAVETLRQHFNYVVFCQAFAATLFTSCFFIRHDGLAPIFVNYIEPATCLLPDVGEKRWRLGFVQRLLRK